MIVRIRLSGKPAAVANWASKIWISIALLMPAMVSAALFPLLIVLGLPMLYSPYQQERIAGVLIYSLAVMDLFYAFSLLRQGLEDVRRVWK